MSSARLSLLVATIAGCSSSSDRLSETQSDLSACVTLGAVADTMVSNPPIDQSFGSLPIMRAGGKDESLVRFALDSIPPQAVISHATLALYISGSGSTSPVYAHAITAPWSEATT